MMAILTCIALIILILVVRIAFLGHSKRNSSLPNNWPLVGTLPALVPHLHRFHDKTIKILEISGGTFQFLPKNSRLLDLDVLFTSNPANVHHIMSDNFFGYQKGPEWRKRFDFFGDSLFNFDFEEWKYHRSLTRGFLNHSKLQEFLPKIFDDSMKKQFIPILDHFCRQDVPVAFQYLVDKHTFYFACKIVTGCEPGSSHDILFTKAISDALEAIASRYFLPEILWKLQKRLGIGKERRLSEAWITVDHLMSEYMSIKRKEISKQGMNLSFSVLELILTNDEVSGQLSAASDKVIKDILFGLLFAARDTVSTLLTWFFWLLSKNPEVEKRIREEIQECFPQINGGAKWLAYGAKELNKLVYLHAALCETLRLYPPVPMQSRSPVQNDTLPSGHKVNERTRILISTYAMGRMTSIWGEDCYEFKPERWITDEGEIKHESTQKFFAFNAGPRICPGKEIAFNLMKATASAIIHNYDVQVVENQRIRCKTSIVLHMREDLMVKVKKRWT